MKLTFGKSPEWFQPSKPRGLERLFLREPMDDYRSQYVHMFLQDVEHLVPLGSRQEREGYFEFETNDRPLATKVIASLDQQYHSHHTADALRHFLSSTAMELFYAGHTIVELRPSYDEFEWQVSSLHPNSASILSIGPLLLQVLPERENLSRRHELETLPSEFRFLDQKKILRVELPRSLRRFRKRLMRRLRLLSDLSYPDTEQLLPRTSLESPYPKGTNFDFKAFRSNFSTALFQTVRDTGWTARDYSGDEKSDFFTAVWRLRFRRFQASLRMDIIQQLNEQLPRIVQHTNPDFQLHIKEKGMLTPDELDEMERQLYAGEISFKEVIDTTFNR
jgi:hypothetical protein